MLPPADVLGARAAGSVASSQQVEQAALQLELPWEVKHRFRTKALTLATLETWIVLGLAFACDQAYEAERTAAFIIMFISLLCAAASLSLFWWLRHRFPVNYLLLFVTTLLAGTFWAYTEKSVFIDSVNMPVQVSIIMAIMITTWLVTAQVRSKLYESEFFFSGLLLGWFLGSVVDFAYVKLTDLPPASTIPPIAGVLLSTVVILAAVARPMLRCCADDYMIVALAFTANLFLLVSVPVVMMLMALGGASCPCDSMESSETQEREQPLPTPQVPEAEPPEPVQAHQLI